MWWKWTMHLNGNALRFSAGTSWSKMGDALDAAMWSALNSTSSILRIEIHK